MPGATVLLNHVIVHGADLSWRLTVALSLLTELLLIGLLGLMNGDGVAWVI
jgi:hypothetical protein